MSLFVCLAAAVAAPPASDIVVTAGLAPVPLERTVVSVSVFDADRFDSLFAPFATDLLRLVPGVTVSSAGGPGAQTQVRIRGAEANHSLLFIDGIAFDDVAADDQARFETMATAGLSQIEVIRGPQSALWGSQALGGVIALQTPDPLGAPRAIAAVEYGSLDQQRGSATLITGGEVAGLSATGAYARGDGIDVLGGGRGDRDGFSNVTASVKGVARPGSVGEFGLVARYVRHEADYDGVDANFLRADSDDASTAETWAVRGWARIGRDADAPWSLMIDAQHLDSSNRNRAGALPVNASAGRRTRIGGTAGLRTALGRTDHSIDARIEREDEAFATRDFRAGGVREPRLRRGRTAFIGEWQGEWGGWFTTDLAIRHDDFSRFRDATTVRAHALVRLSGGLSLVGGYADGIAQPGFSELFGFAANSGFVGNPRLTPERSHGYEAGIRYGGPAVSAEIVAFSNLLKDEIVYSDLPGFQYTYVNAAGGSRRRGIEASGELRPTAGLRLNASYTYLDAREPRVAGAVRTPQEVRRPRHSASLTAEWQADPLRIGGSLAYVGRRRDIDFDSFAPATLNDYVLLGAQLGVRLTEAVELFGRFDNALNARYQDVVGYATAGRTVYAGIRFRMDP